MNIITTIEIKLTDEEKKAINTIMDAYRLCISKACFECYECPLYVNGDCVGKMCDTIAVRGFLKGVKHDN